MPLITFRDYLGAARTIEAPTGLSLMEAARMNDIPGIVAECGGVCACATCHVYVSPDYLERLNPQTDSEAPLLEFLDDVRENSRLACQVQITEALDGLDVQTPETQGL
ncbi:MAG: 2Fe-2S iron-sulfur cluster-binding protein [Pararhodobacter sp.]